MGLVLSFSKRGSVLSIWALKQEICRGSFIFEAWLSLVERCVRDAEAASSNLVASIKNKVPTRAPYSLSKQNINGGLKRNERTIGTQGKNSPLAVFERRKDAQCASGAGPRSKTVKTKYKLRPQ